MTHLELTTLVTAILGAVCGVLGAVLGIVNTWHQLSETRVRLKVTPKLAFQVSAETLITCSRATTNTERLQRQVPRRLCIEVINLSAFPVTISDVGFGNSERQRHTIIQPECSPQNKTFPVRLEAREAFSAYARVGEELNSDIMCKAVAYAETDCGVICYGTSPIFQQYVRALASSQPAG